MICVLLGLCHNVPNLSIHSSATKRLNIIFSKQRNHFLLRVSILMRDIDIANLSVHPLRFGVR